MKQTIANKQHVQKIILVVSLFVAFTRAGAQDQKNSYKIGDKIPDIEFNNLINHSRSKAKISDFKGKAIIIDFWAPWCAPCIAAFPKLDSLQKNFKDKLQVVAVTKDNREFASKLLTNVQKIKNIETPPSVVEDSLISSLFSHRIIPHYIWIDSKGIIKAITGSEELVAQNIKSLIEGKELSLKLKDDQRTQLDDKKPFFTGQVEFEKEVIFHSALTKYIQGLPLHSKRGKNIIRCTSHSIMLLYKLAFGEFDLAYQNNNRVILEGFKSTMDSLEVGRRTDMSRSLWNEVRYNNLYNYELIVPDSGFTTKQMFQIMQSDLNRAFALRGIQGRREKRTIPVLELITTGDVDSLKSRGGKQLDQHGSYYIKIKNRPLVALISKLQAFFSKDGILPIINATGYKGKVDLEINCDLTDIHALNKELQRYRLKLVENKKEMDMIIITRTTKDSPNVALQKQEDNKINSTK